MTDKRGEDNRENRYQIGIDARPGGSDTGDSVKEKRIADIEREESCGDREPYDVEDEDSELFGAAAGCRFCDDEVQSPAQAGCNKRKIGQPDELPFNGMTHIPPLYRIPRFNRGVENLQFELIYIRCEGTASVKVVILATSRFFIPRFSLTN